MNESCIFCKIVAGLADAEILYHDDLVTAFRDIAPQAPTHILIVPNEHLDSVNHVNAGHAEMLARMFTVSRLLAEQEEIHHTGYRLITNTGPDGGQMVFHLHLHLLGGRRLRGLG